MDLLTLILCSTITLWAIGSVQGHGLLLDPPARNTIWRMGFPNPSNYDDMGLNCGGLSNQWSVNNGRCGLCGDPYQGPRRHEAGYTGSGKSYANGFIGQHYKSGAVVPVQAKITANHLGYVSFKLCPLNREGERVTQQCLDKFPLGDGYGNTKFEIYKYVGNRPGVISVSLQLPKQVTCKQCVLQWTYTAGNNNGPVESTPQETFVNCADVEISESGGPKPTPPPAKVERTTGNYKRDAKGNAESDELWDCDLISPYNKGERIQGNYDWCINNCILASPAQRNCQPSMCKCYIIGKGDQISQTTTRAPQQTTQKWQSPTSEEEEDSSMRSEVDWSCDLVSPYDVGTARKLYNLKEWCIENCVLPIPSQRNCPNEMCNCYETRRNVNTTPSTQRVPAPTHRTRMTEQPTQQPTRQPTTRPTTRQSTQSDTGSRSFATWRCQVNAPYNKGNQGRQLQRWCEKNCIEALPHQRNCPATHCNCFERSQTTTAASVMYYQQEGTTSRRTDNNRSRQGQGSRQVGSPQQSSPYITSAGELVSDAGRCRLTSTRGMSTSRRNYLLSYCADRCLLDSNNQRCPTQRCDCTKY